MNHRALMVIACLSVLVYFFREVNTVVAQGLAPVVLVSLRLALLLQSCYLPLSHGAIQDCDLKSLSTVVST